MGFTVPIRVAETHGLRRSAERICIGVPLPRGVLIDPQDLQLRDDQDVALAGQYRTLARWSDGSVKWLQVQTRVAMAPSSSATLRLTSSRQGMTTLPGLTCRADRTDSAVEVDTAVVKLRFPTSGSVLVSHMAESPPVAQVIDVEAVLIDGSGTTLHGRIDGVEIEASGPVVTTVVVSGRFHAGHITSALRFVARVDATAGSSAVDIDFCVWNPQPATHAGGLWDLGDPGSVRFRDLSLICRGADAEAVRLRWTDSGTIASHDTSAPVTIYQDSSGGERWNSPNHVDASGRLTVTFRGFRVTEARNGETVAVASGHRADAALSTQGANARVGIAIGEFWQSFPTALRRRDDTLQAALFPAECSAGFELQGGERKRRRVRVDFAAGESADDLAAFAFPLEVSTDPSWAESTKAVAWSAASSERHDPRYLDYIGQIVSGSASFFARRDAIDEYGWRNFGDLYADHEAVHHIGAEPFITHYNNQYDFVYGAFLQWQRTADPAWRRLMSELARHVIDIDIYHTSGDRSFFNGGLFWHTDHYKPAATCTHRTYSRANAGGGNYGGGPANEHNYSSGLLHYFFATGDPDAADAVRTLADWVCAMDDGRLNPLGLIDESATGAASSSRDRDYHKPGRGAGNSINTLMDAYAVSGDWRYWLKLEELIRRCIHPADDIAALGLDDPENRWSYLVFLQVLGRYLDQKLERGETDYMFWYGRDSLLHYARWMLHHEVPFKDVLHKVELPTETWPAHDVRKCHILHLASKYADNGSAEAEQFRARAAFFYDRCLTDLLAFPTSGLTRPLVILSVYGMVQPHYGGSDAEVLRLPSSHPYHFGSPLVFEPQRTRLKTTLKNKLALVGTEVLQQIRQRLPGRRAR